MNHILIVDDDERLLRLLSHYLVSEGFTVSTATDGEQLRLRLATDQPDLVILDLGLPGEDGLSLMKEIRSGSSMPVIMLTGKASTVDKIVGLEVGADDYVTKPFEERELLARVRSVMRRYTASSGFDSKRVARFAGWKLDRLGHELISPQNQRIHLTSHEFTLLETFIDQPSRTLSRDALLEMLSGRDWNPLDRSIDVLIAKLRKKIESSPRDPELIKTIRGAGYKFTAKVDYE
jgi:two-component system OmpR family response regulator